MSAKHFARALLPSAALLLGGCHLVLLHPAGDVARQQSDIMITTTIIIALIIVPVLIAIGVVAWHYRASNKKAEYDAEWDHSPQLELLVWALPLLIIIAVGAISWIGTHQTDPYRPIDRIAPGQTVPADTMPLEVDVVSLRWKWLFFYPQYGIATVNELAAPIDRPIAFKLTSDSMMNSFFIPTLAGQVYTMPRMQTQLHAIINQTGKYRGISANFSGAGFDGMHFWFYAMSNANFDAWVAKARSAGGELDRGTYAQLSQPSTNAPVQSYAHFAPDLYAHILHGCVAAGATCTEMAAGSAAADTASEPAAAPAAATH